MEAKELRLGNWVIISGLIGETDYIKIPSGKYIDNNHASAKPIPLTPEILEKAGGYRRKFHKRYILKSLYYDFYQNTILCLYNANGQIAECKYLHQLQNLYFALTGEELIIYLQ